MPWKNWWHSAPKRPERFRLMLFFLALLYYSIMGLFTLLLYFAVTKKEIIARSMLFTGMLLAGTGVMTLMLTEHRLPLYGAFEATIYLVFVLTLAEILSWSQKDFHTQLNTCGGTALISLCLLLCSCTQPKTFNPDFFMYGNLWVNLFFNLRLTAAAVFIRGMLLYQVGLWPKHNSFIPGRTDSKNSIVAKKGENTKKRTVPSGAVNNCSPAFFKGNPDDRQKFKQNFLFSRARDMLLVGLVIFLCSEWAGSWWCLNWLGDSWRWSGGFFKAGIVFMLVMLTSHLPPSLSRNPRMKAMTGSLPALFLLWIIFYH